MDKMDKKATDKKFMLLEDLPDESSKVFRITFSTTLDEYDTIRDRLVTHCDEILKEEVEDV